MKTEDKDLLNKDELVKSLQDLDFSPEEIAAVIEKGEKEGKFSPEEKKDDETIDEAAAEKNKPEFDKEEMKKAYDGICSMKADLDKAMDSFLDMFGKVPGFTSPTEFVKKSEDSEIEKSEKTDIEKSIQDNFEKAFGDKFGEIMKGFETQNKVNEDIIKSITGMGETIQKMADAPNPLKGLFSDFSKSVIEKGYKEGENGVMVYDLKNKTLTNEQFSKSLYVIDNDEDKQSVRDLISAYNISGYAPERALNIVKKALKIDFEK